jgi:hypothetical protein
VSAIVEGFTITRGVANDPAGCDFRLCGIGGGILCRAYSSVVIKNNLICDNFAVYDGGGIAIDHASCHIEGNVLVRNATTLAGGFGGGIAVGGSIAMPTIVSNTVLRNTGDGIAIGDGGGIVRRNILAYNVAFLGGVIGGKGVSCAFGAPLVECNDMWGNGQAENCGTAGVGNLLIDPEFCSPEPWATDNYFLQVDSPCLPENNSCGAMMGALGQGCSTVSVRQAEWTKVKILYRDTAR